MKKSFLLILLIFAISTLSLTKETFSGIERPGVGQTPHDLSMGGGTMWSYETTEVCVFCHTPHLGQQQVIYPLWNKSLSGATFNMYTSATFNMGPSTTIGSPSTLCMSCHDGNMAMNMVVNSPGRGTTGSIPAGATPTTLGDIYYPGSGFGYGPANISGNYGGNTVDNLADDHPISFTYNNALDQQGNDFPAPVGGIITGGTSGAKYPLYKNSNGENQFECSTCHAVHDTVSYKGTWPDDETKDFAEVFFLRTSNTESRMCRDCHVAKY